MLKIEDFVKRQFPNCGTFLNAQGTYTFKIEIDSEEYIIAADFWQTTPVEFMKRLMEMQIEKRKYNIIAYETLIKIEREKIEKLMETKGQRAMLVDVWPFIEPNNTA